MRFQKLPLSINTPGQSELLPVISADGKTLYFTRTRIGMDSGTVFDIWMSHITNDSIFSNPEFVGGNLSSSYGIAVSSTSPDNNTLYLIGKLHSDSPPNERVYVTHKTASGWSIPEAIKIQELHLQGLYTDYSFGPDQRTLLMALDRDSSLGARDLYVSFYIEPSPSGRGQGEGSWSTPLWLGADINSRFAEMTPYLASDNKTLYFSSDRPGGVGDVDVYRSRRLDSTWQHWSKPEDLGTNINRLGRTSYYTEDAEGKYAYVAWRRTEREASAIYRIRVERELPVALVHGVVTDANATPLAATIRYERLRDGALLGTARSDPTTGAFQISLPAGENYAIHAERDGYFPTSEHVDVTTLTSFQSVERDLRLNKIESGAAITMKNVFFETDKATLLPASFAELDRVKELLAAHPEFKLQVTGYTDSIGSETHNLRLSKARAEAVAAYLTSKGVASDRLTTIGYGSSKPVATNTTEEGRAQNRRVEFILVSK
jgi:outer membrane protein OmpA-like peptidoglycan-associated protein